MRNSAYHMIYTLPRTQVCKHSTHFQSIPPQLAYFVFLSAYSWSDAVPVIECLHKILAHSSEDDRAEVVKMMETVLKKENLTKMLECTSKPPGKLLALIRNLCNSDLFWNHMW